MRRNTVIHYKILDGPILAHRTGWDLKKYVLTYLLILKKNEKFLFDGMMTKQIL